MRGSSPRMTTEWDQIDRELPVASIKAADVGCRNQEWRRKIAILRLGQRRRIGRYGRANRSRAGVHARRLIAAVRSRRTGNLTDTASGLRVQNRLLLP